MVRQLDIGKSTHAPLQDSAGLALLSMENGLMSSFGMCLDSTFHMSSMIHYSTQKGSIADAIGLSKKNISFPFEGVETSEIGQAKKSFSKPRAAY
ncbi:hypothetical protein MJO29_004268 [Puccinia striiformis f. sp. tritici]|nr:hypothetical protein MJO29_004268 [Puccinia striiformis f. sp. tritici]